MMEKKRPVGVIVTGIIFILLSLPSLPIALLAGISGYYGKGLKELLIDIFMRIICIGAPIALIFSGIGLLGLKKWGRICAIVAAIVISLVLCGSSIAKLIDKSLTYPLELATAVGMGEQLFLTCTDKTFILLCFIRISVFISIIFYLTRPKVKEQFK